jgi:hypothetical protein
MRLKPANAVPTAWFYAARPRGLAVFFRRKSKRAQLRREFSADSVSTLALMQHSEDETHPRVRGSLVFRFMQAQDQFC